MPNSVTPIMPENTVIPSDQRSSAPAPRASTSGRTPRMKASEVMRIGRNRSRLASTVASASGFPSCMSCLANSTMRIAFLQASPTSTTNPIWVKIVTSMPAWRMPTSADRRHIGTTRMTASGKAQLS